MLGCWVYRDMKIKDVEDCYRFTNGNSIGQPKVIKVMNGIAMITEMYANPQN